MAKTVEQMIKESTCFGYAYDESVKECKICEVCKKCKAKCEGAKVDTPKKPDSVVLADKDEVSESEAAAKKSAEKEKSKDAKKPTTKPKKESNVKYADDMPDFQPMSLDEIQELLVNRGGNLADFDKYKADNIKRMRMVMALKKTYEV